MGLDEQMHHDKEKAIRVVIAEDHTLVREGTRGILEQDRDIAVVGEAADGEEAVRISVELRPDVVLMDVAMPHVNGIEATRRLKEHSPGTAVVILSAYDDDAYVFAMLEAGAAGYLMKTASSEELVTAVKAAFAGESVLSPIVARKVLGRFASLGSGEVRTPTGEPLTDRERKVLLLASKGLTNKAIGKALSVSPRTVQGHLDRIFDKLGVASRTEAVITGLKRGWLRLEDLT